MDEEKINTLKQLAFENNDEKALSELIDYYQNNEDYEELRKIYEFVLHKNPISLIALKELADIYTNIDKDYTKAKEYYEKALLIDDTDSELHFQYGSLLEFKFADYEKAKDHYLKSIELNPQNVDAYLNLSWLFLDGFDDVHSSYIVVQEALKYLEDSEIYSQLGYIELMKYRDYEEAYKHLQKSIELDKDNDLAYTYLGQLHILEKDYDKAKEVFSKALDLEKINELLIFEFGKLLIVQYKDFKGAISILEKAIEIYPERVIYYAYLANLYFILGNINEARKNLRRAENFTINEQEALLMIGYLKVMLDDNKDEALMYFEKVIELNPSNLNALSFIGFYNLINNKQIDTALEYFKKIADLSNDSFIIHFIIAQIYLQYYNDSTQALEYLLKINLNALNKIEQSHLLFVIGNIYEKYVKNNHLALDYYEQAYQIKPDKYLEEVINNIYEKDKTIIN